jgi:hypothetical protein
MCHDIYLIIHCNSDGILISHMHIMVIRWAVR